MTSCKRPREKGTGGVVKKIWTEEEDGMLLRAVESHGCANWALVGQHVPSRTGKQCRERYCNHLSPSLKKTDWSFEEDRIIETLQALIGNQWCKFTKALPGRTDNSIKNRYHANTKVRGSIPLMSSQEFAALRIMVIQNDVYREPILSESVPSVVTPESTSPLTVSRTGLNDSLFGSQCNLNSVYSNGCTDHKRTDSSSSVATVVPNYHSRSDSSSSVCSTVTDVVGYSGEFDRIFDDDDDDEFEPMDCSGTENVSFHCKNPDTLFGTANVLSFENAVQPMSHFLPSSSTHYFNVKGNNFGLNYEAYKEAMLSPIEEDIILSDLLLVDPT